MLPAPRQKPAQISPIFISDKVTLHVSREKDGKLHLVDADGTIRRSFSRTAAGKLAGGWKGGSYLRHGKPWPPPVKNRDPP